MSAGWRELAATRLAAGRAVPGAERVADEVAIGFVYNGEPYAVMMATPDDLEDFAVGFSLTEGVVAGASEVELVDATRTTDGIALALSISSARYEAMVERRRAFEGRAGCGICGIGVLDVAMRAPRVVAPGAPVAAASIASTLAALAAAQPLNAATGGVHAAAWCGPGGMLVREDVGRHNAIDKLVGALARGEHERDGALVVTSRASYEVVHKAASAGIGVVAAISAPTTLAIRVAEQAGVALAAFARGGAMTVYAHLERIVP